MKKIPLTDPRVKPSVRRLMENNGLNYINHLSWLSYVEIANMDGMSPNLYRRVLQCMLDCGLVARPTGRVSVSERVSAAIEAKSGGDSYFDIKKMHHVSSKQIRGAIARLLHPRAMNHELMPEAVHLAGELDAAA